jgi:hypothetical protein
MRANYWHGGFQKGEILYRVEADIEELGGEVRLGKPLTRGAMTLEPFAAAGAGLMWQHFDAIRKARNRVSAAGHVDAGAAFRHDLLEKRYILVEAALQTYLFRRQSETESSVSPTVGFAVTAGLIALHVVGVLTTTADRNLQSATRG